eukprot:10904229-Heterocapsa_arctica.AAC.1
MIFLAPVGGLLWSALGAVFYSVLASFTFCMAAGDSEYGNSGYVVWQCTSCLSTMLLGSHCAITYMASHVHQSVARKTALAEREAVSSLLDIVCDA